MRNTTKILLKNIMLAGLARGADKIEIRDEEGVLYRGRDIYRALENIESVEECGINFIMESKYVGWVGVMPFELTEDATYDCDDNEFVNSICKKARVGA